jgi:hypothetical protein
MDHKPLVGALACVSDPWMTRQCRHLAYVAEFTADIRHVAGLDNIAADALSRPRISSVTASTYLADMVADLCGIATRQSSCPGMLQASKSPSLRIQGRKVEGANLLCNGSTGH